MTALETHLAKVEAFKEQVDAYQAQVRVYNSLFTPHYVNQVALDSLIRCGRYGAAARFLLQHPELL